MAALVNDKHELFCNEYMIDLNGTQAYIRSGYSEKGANVNACKLIANHNIHARINELMEERSKNILIDAYYVVSSLKDVSERCRQAVPVMIFNGKFMEQKKDDEGNGVWEFDSNGANKALELIGKHVGAFEKDNSQLTPKIKIVTFK